MMRTCLPSYIHCWPMAEPVYRRKVLEAGRVGRRGGDDGRVLQRAGLFEGATHGGDRRTLLTDGDVDAADLLLGVARAPVVALVDDRVDSQRGLAGLTVADDQLTLATADRGHRVDGLVAGLHRLVHRLADHDARGLQLEGAAAGGLDLAEAVDRVAERVDDAAEVALAHGDGQHLAGALHRLALLDTADFAEDDRTDLALFQVRSARPRVPSSNFSSSFAIAEGRPSILAIPSPATVTVPTSSREAASGLYDWTKFSSASRISSGRIVSSAIWVPCSPCWARSFLGGSGVSPRNLLHGPTRAIVLRGYAY